MTKSLLLLVFLCSSACIVAGIRNPVRSIIFAIDYISNWLYNYEIERSQREKTDGGTTYGAKDTGNGRGL